MQQQHQFKTEGIIINTTSHSIA